MGQNLWGVIAAKIGNTPVKLYNQINLGQLKMVVPVDASGQISVTTYYGTFTLASPSFSRIIPATITSISPLNALPGNSMIISGQGFGTNLLAVDVHFGPVKATINSLQDNTINVTIPVSAAYGPVSVTVQHLISFSSQRFTPANPAIADLNLNAKSFMDFSTKGTEYSSDGSQIYQMDLNGDGKPDFVTLNSSVNFYINASTPGKPSWKYSHTAPNIYFLDNVQTGDIDGDGKQDLLLYGIGPTRYILRNTSSVDSCSFAAEAPVTTDPGLLFDMNNDGKIDITRPDPNTFQPQIFINNSIPGSISFKDTLSNSDITTMDSWKLVLIADLDKDGLPDLIGTRYQQTLLFRNTGTRQIPSFTVAPIIFNSLYNPIKALTADMNGDGSQDLFILYAGAVFSMYKNISTPGAIQFKSQQLVVNDYAREFDMFNIADLNGDNHLDIVTKSESRIFIYQNNRSTDSIILKDTVTLYNLHATACVADIDGDNKQDIVTSSSSLFVMRNRMNESQSTKVCPNSTISLPATISGTSYQWQMDTGAGFVNISNDVNFSNTSGAILTITNTPSNWLKRQFRCKINNSLYSEPYFLEFENTWISNISHDWNLPSNWSCGVVPDGNTAVIITNGKTVELTGDGSCRSLLINPYASFTILPGFRLVITNK